MPKSVRITIALKFILLCILIGFSFKNTRADQTNSDKNQAKDKTESTPKAADQREDWSLPTIPQKVELSKSLELREQLEVIRRDVLNKIAELNQQKLTYLQAKEEINKKVSQLKQDQTLLDETLQKEKVIQDSRLKEAIVFIQKMDPRKLGTVVEDMDRDLVVALLQKIPQKQATKILESVSPPKATQLIEYYTRIRSAREYELLKDIQACKK